MTSVRRRSVRGSDNPPRPADTPVVADTDATGAEDSAGVGRRGFLGWVLAAPTLMVGVPLVADLAGAPAAAAAEPTAATGAVPAIVIPSPPEPSDLFDLGDLQDLAALPTSNLITVTVNTDGTASFALPRSEVGQGITTSTSMLIAEELDLPLSKVNVTLADARPELLFNQLTGGSNTTRSTYTAIRTAAGLARLRLVQAAAKQWRVPASTLTTKNGAVRSPDGRVAGYGSLAKAAAASTATVLQVQLKPVSKFSIIGKPQNRVDALAAVTGQKQYTLDMKVPGAMPTMVCRPPTVNGTVKSVSNMAAVRKYPGVTDVGIISTGVAVRAATFGQCIDAVRALKVVWNGGTEDGRSDDDIVAELVAAELPLGVPSLPVLTQTVDERFTFWFASNSPLETGSAIADVRADSAEIWSCLKVPIVAQSDIATMCGLPISAVTCHVTQGGGSFGRHLFADAAMEAAEISKLFAKPVKLMWHRTDDFRQGRVHPLSTSRVRATYLAGQVLTYEQRHTSVSTDFTHGLGEILTAFSSRLPAGNYTFAQSIFLLTANVSYNYGVTDQLLNEVDMGFNTGSMRNIYSPNVCIAQELVTDQLAKLAGQDAYAFRRAFLKDDRSRAVLDKVAQVGGWGRKMPKGTAQGIAFHAEYKGVSACLVEIDNRPATVNRKIPDAYTGPRVTKVVFAVDVGLPINPRGLEAQMQGGIMDGIALTLTSSLHLDNGTFAEGSWDNYWYTREWNVPPSVQVIVMPATSENPGGAGEFGVAATAAAVACAYGRATGTMPLEFPINHRLPLGFDVLPTTPSIPQSPTDGLDYAY